jgi:hypothetical protein
MRGSAAYVRPTAAWVFGIRKQDARAERHRRPMPVLAALLRGAGHSDFPLPVGQDPAKDAFELVAGKGPGS